MTAAELAGRLHGHKAGSGWMARCPAHDDRNPSLSISEKDGKPLIRCHAGCEQSAVITALKARGLWEAQSRESSLERRIVATYDYRDLDGKLLYQVVRLAPKDFRQRRPDGKGGWIWNLKGVDRVLYRLREVIEAPIVFLVEGEKDAETLRDWGFVATTAAGGASAPWLPRYTDALRSREVILIPDTDHAGWKRGEEIARALLGNVARLRLYPLPEGIKDVTEFFERGHSETELIAELEGCANV